jgi:hypothetical protein
VRSRCRRNEITRRRNDGTQRNMLPRRAKYHFDDDHSRAWLYDNNIAVPVGHRWPIFSLVHFIFSLPVFSSPPPPTPLLATPPEERVSRRRGPRYEFQFVKPTPISPRSRRFLYLFIVSGVYIMSFTTPPRWFTVHRFFRHYRFFTVRLAFVPRKCVLRTISPV